MMSQIPYEVQEQINQCITRNKELELENADLKRIIERLNKVIIMESILELGDIL
jgi:regulator of replication initiation timing